MNARGYVDVVDARAVVGWAWIPENPSRKLFVELYDGELLLARLRADVYRKDLEEASVGDGRHGFEHAFVDVLRDGCEHEIHVCFEGTRIDLTSSPRRVVFNDSPHRTPELAGILREQAPATTWNVELVAYEDQFICVKGWALPSLTGEECTFTINGGPLSSRDHVSHGLWRPEVGNIFWYVPGAARAGFIFTIECLTHNFTESDVLCIDYVDAQGLVPGREHQEFYFNPAFLRSIYPTPAPDGILRIAGYESPVKYLLEGYTTFRKLLKVLETVSPRSLDQFCSILDWGCGCGRLTRHIIEALPTAGTAITGIDIDRGNLQWCQTNLPRASFHLCGLQPPTQMPSASFDLIFGISVFTHMDEATQFAWLNELKRLSMPGALLLLTTQGNTSVCRTDVTEQWLEQWRERGLDDSWRDPALNSEIDDKDYYRASFHTIEYIQKHWTAYFEIVTIIEGIVSNHQDLIVLRNR